MSLYRKYRPQNFANLVGQDHVRNTVLNELKHDRVSHAFLFAGPRGTGKTSTARLIAKAINCTARNEEFEPCDECEFCVSITGGNFIDVIEIDAASNRGIDEIRDLREKIKFAPTYAQSKVYIIDEVHMLTKEAFNALLKTLEEPPPSVYFILATTEVHKIPETIISRCQRFDFKRINIRTIMTRLQFIAQEEGIEAEDKAIELIARYVSGGLRDAITLLEQMVMDKKISYDHVRAHLGVAGHKTIEQLCQILAARDLRKALHLVNEIYNEGYDLDMFIREVLDYMRETLLKQVEDGKVDETAPLLAMIDAFVEAKEGLRSAPIPQLPIEIAIIKICKGGLRSFTEQQPQSESAELIAAMGGSSDAETKEETMTVEKISNELNEVDDEHEETDGESGTLESNWPRVVQHVQPPSLRRSLSTGRILKIDENELTLGFEHKFHFEKIDTVESKASVEKALEAVCKKPVKLVCTLQKIALQSVPEIDEIPASPQKKITPAKEEDIGARAMEIFGGEEF